MAPSIKVELVAVGCAASGVAEAGVVWLVRGERLAAPLTIFDPDSSKCGRLPGSSVLKSCEHRTRARLGRRLKLPNGKRRNVVNTGWKPDCLRHTFASHYPPVFGADKTIAHLGHGDYDMLFGHYRNLLIQERRRSFGY